MPALTVVITGASRGIGKSLAKHFAQRGDELLLTARNKETLTATITALQKEFTASTIHGQAADLSIPEQAREFGRWCLSFSEPDILINNAGQFLPGSLAEEPDGQLEQQLRINLGSAYHLTRTLIPTMIQRGTGHIFTICSIASLDAYENGGSYSISKFALLGFSKNLRLELKDKGIKVTAVFPGAVFTNSWAGSGVDPKRIMESSDIAKMIYAATQLSAQAVVEDIVMRPQLGDL